MRHARKATIGHGYPLIAEAALRDPGIVAGQQAAEGGVYGRLW
jgi:hypothetical protein